MLIGISGKIGAGKNALAECIMEVDSRFETRSFAGKLKQTAALLTGYKDQYTREGKDTYLPEWQMTVREFQQRLGTEAMRYSIHTDGWILALFADYKIYHNRNQCSAPHKHTFYCEPNWLITDVRFINEAEAIKQRSGFLVRIDGSREPQQGEEAAHYSETALDDYTGFDYRFDNSSLSWYDLKAHACFILKEVIQRDLYANC